MSNESGARDGAVAGAGGTASTHADIAQVRPIEETYDNNLAILALRFFAPLPGTPGRGWVRGLRTENCSEIQPIRHWDGFSYTCRIHAGKIIGEDRFTSPASGFHALGAKSPNHP